MGYSMKRIIAVFLCMILCMTNMELYAAETDNTGSGGLEEEMQTAVDETEVMETVSLYLEESEPAETDEPETADIEPTKTETAETEPDETETETVETEPDETETKPDETEPDETETQISETETVASEIAETEALETELTDEQSEQSVEELLSELQEEVDRQFQEDGYCASGYIDSGFEADRLGILLLDAGHLGFTRTGRRFRQPIRQWTPDKSLQSEIRVHGGHAGPLRQWRLRRVHTKNCMAGKRISRRHIW